VVVELEMAVHDPMDSKKQELRVWLRLLSTTKLISQEIRRRLRAEFGATLPQFDLLAQLYREPDGLRLGEISKRTMVTNGNITGLVARLEEDGLVYRETPGDDRRVTVARLTEAGQLAFAEMARVHELWIHELMADIDHNAVSALVSGIDQLQRSVRNHLSDTDE
jgi:DNA-binding MarR family transcriptional regulator